MRNRFKLRVLGFALILFGVCLLPFALAVGPKVLGQIVRSQGTSLGGTVVPNEGSIVAGDIVETTSAGGALLRFASGAEAVLGTSTRVTFSDETGKLTAHLLSGGLTIEAPGTAAIVTLTPICEIDPVAATAATLRFLFGAAGAAVEARRGTVRVTALQSGGAQLVSAGEQVLVAQNVSKGSPAAEQQETGKPSPSVPAGPAQPASTNPSAPVSTSTGAPEESGQPSPSQPAGPSTPAPARHHSSSGIILLVAGIAGAAGAALAASGGGRGPASPSGP